MTPKTTYYACYFDGACEPNPKGEMGIGAFILNPDRQYVFKYSVHVSASSMAYKTSNNVAEYMALIAVLTFLDANKLHNEHIIIAGDSEMVINQMKMLWKSNGGEYVPYFVKARTIAQRFYKIEWKWIPREQNAIADALSKHPMVENGCEFRIQKQ